MEISDQPSVKLMSILQVYLHLSTKLPNQGPVLRHPVHSSKQHQ